MEKLHVGGTNSLNLFSKKKETSGEQIVLGSKNKISSIRKLDTQMVYFVTFLSALASGEISPIDLFKTAGVVKYGVYTDTFDEVYSFGVGWRYGVAHACELIAQKTADSLLPLKHMLVRLGQIIRLGDDLNLFFTNELKTVMHTFEIEYEKSLESMKQLLEMHYTMMSSAVFMLSSVIIMSMISGSSDSESQFLSAFFGIMGGLATFVFLIFFLYPRENNTIETKKEKKKQLMILAGIGGAGAGIGIVLLVTELMPAPLIPAISLAAFILPGIIAKRKESEIKKLEQWYPTFIRHFGEIYSVVGSMSASLETVLRSNFGPLNKNIVGLHNRILNKVPTEDAFDLFSEETKSVSIESGNTIMSRGISHGAKINHTANMIGEISSKINDMKEKRQMVSKTFENITIMLHVLSISVFGLMNVLVTFFHTILSGVEVKNMAVAFAPIDPELLNTMMPVMIVTLTFINSFAIKAAQGGSFHTVWFNVGLLGVIGAVAGYAVGIMVEGMFSDIGI